MSSKNHKKRHFLLKVLLVFLTVSIPLNMQNLFAQAQQTIKAKIIDEEDQPLIGVSVIVKGTSTGTTTDFNGEFSIRVPSGKTLVLTYVGFVTQELSATAANGKVIKMYESSKLIDELVVVGYGTQRKIDVSGSVSSVNSDVTRERVILNIGDALKGKVSGVVVTAMDGQPGSTNSISIRGNTSLSGDSEPLYIIDGVISEATDVIPSQIATIDILKDASSTAIYGSRGANGVILITTTQGTKNTKARVNFYGLYGTQQLTKFMPMMNSEQFADFKYLTYINSAGANYDASVSGQPWGDVETGAMLLSDDEGRLWTIARNAYFNTYFYHEDQIPGNTDWQKEIYRNAPIQDYRLTISGGGDKSTYSVMLGRKIQDGIQIASGYNNYNFRVNLRQAINNKMNFGLSSSLQQVTTDPSKATNILNLTPFLNVNEPARKLPNEDQEPTTIQNPLFYTKLITNVNKELVYINNGTFDWQIIKGLVLNLSGSYTTRNFTNEKFYPGNVTQGGGKNSNGIATLTQRSVEELRSENTLQYNSKKGSHNYGIMLGNSFSTRTTKISVAENSNFTLQDLGIWGMGEGLAPSTPSYGYIGVNNVSWFGRVNYTFADKYIFKASMRADASSVFAKNNKWGYFPSVGAAWRINEEPFLRSVKDITNLKLRFSYGVSGKQSISPYQSLSTAILSKITPDGLNNMSTLIFSRLGNDNLKWETTRETNLGFDLGLFKDKLNLVFDVYEKRTFDLLYEDPLPHYSGFRSQMTNVGEISNRGIELGINAIPFKKRNGLTWEINFNISKNISKIISLGQQDFKLIGTGWSKPEAVQGILKVGDPLGNWYGYKTNGLWQSYAEIEAARANGTLATGIACHPGYIKYQDVSGPDGVPDGKITSDDRQVLGNGFPDFTGGLTNSFSYKGVGLTFTLQYSYGQDVFNATAWGIDAVSPSTSGYSYHSALLNSFRPTLYHFDAVTGEKGEVFIEGINSNRYPTFMAQRINNTEEVPLDWYVEDASFLRLADITLSYTVNSKMLSKLKLSNVKLFLTGTNLYVLTNYSGYDPEVNSSRGQASYLMPGLDSQSYPKSRIISAGINVAF
ncbi:MAG: TonB-dependent receptor [Paludibacter sp.]|jgi:TonB-linked SusC/RagA family outer membrane protein|nr:TonB-dependent receptor [Paludibacter sp.]